MKELLLFSLLICFLGELTGQTELVDTDVCISRNDSVQLNSGKEVVYTPFGPTNKYNVHYVDGNHRLNFERNRIKLVNKVTGEVSQEFNSVNYKSTYKIGKREQSKLPFRSILREIEPDNGWITYAYGESVYGLSSPYSYYSASWKVPSPPIKYSNQLVYLFIAMDGVSFNENSAVAHIIQSVLQWGESPAGGGKYWAICNWHVTNQNQFFFDSLIKVNPGTTLQGIIKLTSVTDGQYSYKSYFEGYETGLEVTNLPELLSFYVVLEAYNVYGCDEYPGDEKLRVNNINIMTGDVYPKLNWHTSKDFERPVNDCSQFTEIVNGSSQNGEVDINFHTPTSIDDYDDFHIFPNPAKDYLNISPNRSVLDCSIEVFNVYGKLIHEVFIKSFDYELDMDFSQYAPGLYFIRLSYYKSKYSLKESTHTFKVLKI